MMTRWGGYLDRIDEFDADFFGISPREAERMDPQQRLLLETAWEALEDAGQDLKRIEPRSASVFVGQWTSDFESRLFADPEAVDFQMTTGSGRYAASGRLSYLPRFSRAEPDDRHRVLVVAGGDPLGGSQHPRRRKPARSGGRRERHPAAAYPHRLFSEPA